MSREKVSINPITAAIIIVSLFVITGLIKNAISLYQSRSRLESVRMQIKVLEEKKSTIEQELANQTDPAALDQAIRNKLNLSKPGETVIVITGTPAASTSSPLSQTEESSEAPIIEWWHLLNPPKP